MICIEERGHQPESAAAVNPPVAHGPVVPTGSFALRLRLGPSFAREYRVGRVRRRLDVAVAQVAAADAYLLRIHRDAADRGWTAFRAARTALAHQDAIPAAV